MLKIRLVLFCQIKNERVIINLRLDILNNFCNMEAKGKFQEFMQLNRELLDCYGAHVSANDYKEMNILTQRDFCYAQRVRIEEQLIKGKIQPRDFFAAIQ